MFDRPFQEVEHESWSQKATVYDTLFGEVSTQAVDPILNSLGDLAGKRHLDVACGTGHLVAAAVQRGAFSEGIDFAAPMIKAARANYPRIGFQVADATQLPYDAASFDAVTCVFGLPHMANPQAAVNEAFRILKPGGHYAFTLWFGAERGGELQAIVKSAIQAHAIQAIVLPETWTVLRFADETTCEVLVSQSGFLSPTFQTIPICWRPKTAQQVVNFIDKLSLRTTALLASQPDTIRARIEAQILSEAESHRRDNVICLAWPALLTVAQKPA